VERSFGNYLGGRAKRVQVKELRRLREQADAMREQIDSGMEGVAPEEWTRFNKLEGRLKEEKRLLKMIARQTDDSRTELVRAAVADLIELGETPVLVALDVDEAPPAAAAAAAASTLSPRQGPACVHSSAATLSSLSLKPLQLLP